MERDALYFFSDVHFGLNDIDTERRKESILIDFLDYASGDAGQITIVGDLFDFWMEYREVVPKGFYRFFSKMYELIDRGIKINYIAGNHDFWNGKFFKDEFNITIEYDPVSEIHDGLKFFIHHGDGLAYNDLGYLILKKILRNNVNQFLYSLIHPDLGIKIAKRSSSTSRVHTDKKDYTQKDGLKDFAFKKIDEGYDYVIMGHRHKPSKFLHNNGVYINLGDWIKNFTYAKYKDGQMDLIRYFDNASNKVVNEIL